MFFHRCRRILLACVVGNPHCPRKRSDSRGVDRILLFEKSRPSSSETYVPESEQQIRCTDCLVRRYNGTPDEGKKKALARRLYTYRTVFGKLMSWKKAENAEEYARVANIEVRCLRGRELVYMSPGTFTAMGLPSETGGTWVKGH